MEVECTCDFSLIIVFSTLHTFTSLARSLTTPHTQEETSLTKTAPEASPSMAKSSKMRTSSSSTLALVFSPWPMPARAPMDLNFSYALPRPLGWTGNMWCLARWSRGWRWWRRWRRWAARAERPASLCSWRTAVLWEKIAFGSKYSIRYSEPTDCMYSLACSFIY
jgi:hypothetical protein